MAAAAAHSSKIISFVYAIFLKTILTFTLRSIYNLPDEDKYYHFSFNRTQF